MPPSEPSSTSSRVLTHGAVALWFIGITIISFVTGVLVGVGLGWNPYIVWALVYGALILGRIYVWMRRGQLR